MMFKLIQIMIVLFAFGVLCYIGVAMILLDRLKRVKADAPKPVEQKLLNPKQVRSVGTVRVAEPVPVRRECRGCGRPAYLHENEADFNYCNRKATYCESHIR